MSTRIHTGRSLGRLLVEEGVIQGNCRDCELVVPLDGLMTLRCDLLVEDKDIEGIKRALTRLLEPPKETP